MTNKLFVSNIKFTATREDVMELFGNYGEVSDIHLINDKETGKPRGFVTFKLPTSAQRAISELDGSDFLGRQLSVKEAREREQIA
jgi:cold-inducible RNA-binding protein